MKTMTIKDIQTELGVGRILAERYARQSGLLLPRVKKGPYIVPREAFLSWINSSCGNESAGGAWR